MGMFEELVGEIQRSLDESNRMVMESTPDATVRALRLGTTRAASLLEARIAQGVVEPDDIGPLRRRFRSGGLPDEAILKTLHVPVWLGRAGKSAWDVVGGSDVGVA